MKKYPRFDQREKCEALEQKLDELLFIKELLRIHNSLNTEFCGKAHVIAAGLRPWIDVWKCKLEQ